MTKRPKETKPEPTEEQNKARQARIKERADYWADPPEGGYTITPPPQKPTKTK